MRTCKLCGFSLDGYNSLGRCPHGDAHTSCCYAAGPLPVENGAQPADGEASAPVPLPAARP